MDPILVFFFNTTVHTETKYTPYELVFGKVCKIPSNLVNATIEPLYNIDSYPLELKFRIQKAQEDVHKNLIQCKTVRKVKHDAENQRFVKYKPSDLILVKSETGNKLSTVFDDPYKVIVVAWRSG